VIECSLGRTVATYCFKAAEIYRGNKMQRYTVYFTRKLLYMLLFECAVGGVRHPQHTQTSSNSSTAAADSSNGVTNTRCCRYSCFALLMIGGGTTQNM